jgi:DNA-binding response OmpR family regulator
MKILFVYGSAITKGDAESFLLKGNYEVDAVHYLGLIGEANLESRLAPYEAVIVETHPGIRKCMETPAIIGLHRRIKAVYLNPVIALTGGLLRGETKLLDQLGVVQSPLDFNAKKHFSSQDIWRAIRATLTKRKPAKEGKKAPQVEGSNPKVIFDGEERTITYGGKTAKLADYEYMIVDTLIHNPGAIVTKPDIFRTLWGAKTNPDDLQKQDNQLRVFLHRIKRKLSVLFPERDMQTYPIEMVWGIGGKWVGPDPIVRSAFFLRPRKLKAWKPWIGKRERRRRNSKAATLS